MASSGLQLGSGAGQFSTFLRGLTAKQKAIMAGSVVLVVGTLVFFVNFAGKPDFKSLATGMSASDAQSLNAKLAAKGIKAQVTPDGTGVEVASEQIDKARLEVSADGGLQGGRMGFELFDKPNWMGSDFAEKVNYQRALEGELEKTISSLQEVEAARVHLVLEKESLFSERQREAKAAVVLKLRRQLPPDTAAAITQLVANAVDGLSPQNVSLVNSDGHSPLLPHGKGPYATAGQGDLEDELAQQLVATLEPVLGAGHVKANVRVEYDLGTTEETRETYDPNSAVAIAMQRSKERSPSSVAGGVPGTASNVPSANTSVPKPQVTVSDTGSSTETENGTYVVNRTVRHVSQPAGNIKRVSAAVLVDDGGKPRPAEELKKLEGIARASLGMDTTRGDTLVVESVAFQAPPKEAVPVTPITEKVTRTVYQFSGLLRIAAVLLLFGLVYLFILKPVKNQVLASVKAVPAQMVAANEALVASNQKQAASIDSGVNARKELVNRVKAEPEAATRLLQSWIREPEARP